MALPPSLNTVRVTGTWVNSIGAPCAGAVTFTLSATLYDRANQVIVKNTPIVATLTGGSIDVEIPATNDPDLIPRNNYYTVTVAITGSGSTTFTMLAPYTNVSGIDLSSVIPVVTTEPDPIYLQMRLDALQDVNLAGLIDGDALGWDADSKMWTPVRGDITKLYSGPGVTVNIDTALPNGLSYFNKSQATGTQPGGAFSGYGVLIQYAVPNDNTNQTMFDIVNGGVYTRYRGSGSSTWNAWHGATEAGAAGWTNLPLHDTTVFAAYGGASPVYRLKSNGDCEVRGMISVPNPTPNPTTVIGTLPAGFRPQVKTAFGSIPLVVASADGFAEVRIATNGDIQWINGSPGTWLSLNFTFSTLP